MRGTIDIIEVAAKNLKRAGIRTFLTLIGVVIGIAAIVSLLSIGQGLSVAIEQQFEQLGSNTIFVVPSGMRGRDFSTISLTQSDIDKIEGTKGVESVVPIYTKSAVLEYNGQKVSVSIISADAKKTSIFEDTGFFDVSEGSMPSKNDSTGILIGDNVSKTFFDRELNIRKKVTIDGKEFSVRGILAPQSQNIGGDGPNTGGTVFMSLDAFKRITSEAEIKPGIVFVKSISASEVKYTADLIKKDLERKYGEKSISVSTSEQVLNQINSVLGLLTLFLAGVGGISLIVGGVGIMNAMITSVMERTKEIGVMKALGASDNKILAIFVLEASFIGGVGGIIGIITGYSLASIVAAFGRNAGFNLIAYMGIEITIGALIFSMLVGMISGLLPAIRAAKLDPVTALRYE